MPQAKPAFPRSRRVSLVAAGLLAAAVCPWPARAAPERAKVVIGLLLPPEEAEAASLRAGVLLAVEQANLAPTSSVTLVKIGRAHV